MRLFLTLSLAVLWIGSGMMFLAHCDLASRFRTDIKPGGLPTDGRHSVWQLNVLDPRSYSREGRAAYKRLLVLFAITMLSGIGCLYLVLGFVERAI